MNSVNLSLLSFEDRKEYAFSSDLGKFIIIKGIRISENCAIEIWTQDHAHFNISNVKEVLLNTRVKSQACTSIVVVIYPAGKTPDNRSIL